MVSGESASVAPSATLGNKPPLLRGIRVLDLSRFLSGPQATLFLAGMGAEVIKIDDPRGGDPTFTAPPYFGPHGVALDRRSPHDLGIAYLKRARGKKSISLDLKSKEGREILLKLVREADVLVENFKAGVTARLGIEYETLRANNPRLIYCSITGYGSTGPERHRKAFDLMVQAATGMMSITGDPDGQPSKTGASLSDGIAGTFALAGILGALYQRHETGLGQFIDVSMADCLLSLIFDEPFERYADLGLAPRQGNRIARFSPFNTYRAADGSVAIGTGTAADWTKLLGIMGREDLLNSSDFMNPGWRIENNEQVDAVVEAWAAGMHVDEIIKQLDEADITCGPIRTIEDVVGWDQLRVRDMLQPVRNPNMPGTEGPLAAGFPLKFSEADAFHDPRVPVPSEHNAEIYEGLLRLSKEEIAGLGKAGIV
ncbi:CoA transferase [Bradyrhizobium lablabi]|uniref:CaiB/BaiF CoA transferase family protein n=1 Tax=Bradyrhizobium lablabi TaxID=722472 RepID=UPI001BA5B902|nr:CoA transferase [Bradyrhizobium lablabi]MBR1121855.1 CoA transferase [Bradyrhizobium lablabi]